MKKILIPICAAIFAVLLAGGCAHTDSRAQPAAANATLGQQLEDLKKAYESKAISKREYKEEKKRLLKDY